VFERGHALAILAVVALNGCSSSSSAPPPRGWFRAEVRSADGIAVPFLLELPAGSATAKLRTGSYEYEAAIVDEKSQLKIRMPIFNTEIVVRAAGGGLSGDVQLFTSFGGRSKLALAATPIAAPTLAALRDPHLPVVQLAVAPTTFWRIRFGDGSAGKLVLRRDEADGFDAIVTRDNGDITYLGGASTNPLVLGGFDGTAAIRLEIAMTNQRTVAAKWTGGQALDWRENLTLVPVEADFALPTRIRLEAPGTRIELSELAAAKGKPVVLEVGASWCSTCHALAPVLLALYREFHPKGLEIVTLLFELSTDAAYNAQQVERFKAGYQIPWSVAAVPGELGEVRIPGMKDADIAAFPLLLFLNADHVLVGTQVGFPMHAGDPAHATAVRDLRTSVAGLVEPPDPIQNQGQ